MHRRAGELSLQSIVFGAIPPVSIPECQRVKLEAFGSLQGGSLRTFLLGNDRA